MAKYKVGGNIATDYLRDATTQQLAFNENADFETWKKQIRNKAIILQTLKGCRPELKRHPFLIPFPVSVSFSSS